MSVGSILGAAAGAVIGFFVGGGPMGAVMGAVAGFGLGMLIDPIASDEPNPIEPTEQFQYPKNEIGAVVPDALGTVTIVGTLLLYGDERAETVYVESTGSKGISSGQAAIKGHRFYMTWIQSFGKGPYNELISVFRNDELVWDGSVLIPSDRNFVSIYIPTMGYVDFYFGTIEQERSSYVTSLVDDSTLAPRWKGLCYAVFRDCRLGFYNRLPSMRFVLRKTPTLSVALYERVGTYDYNPVHAIYYILVKLTGLSSTWINSDSFGEAAVNLIDESLGISMLMDSANSALSHLETITSHIDGIIKYGAVSAFTGVFAIKLLREDYTVADLPSVDENMMLDDPTFNRASWIDTVNELRVQYSDLYNVTREGSEFDSPWDAMAGGLEHTVMKGPEGSAWSLGDNTYGQLGQIGYFGSVTYTKTPTRLLFGASVRRMFAGENQTFVINSDGDTLAAGLNDYYQCGVLLQPTSIVSELRQMYGSQLWLVGGIYGVGNKVLGLSESGDIYGWGSGHAKSPGAWSTATALYTGYQFSHLAVGDAACAALKIDGSVWTWGDGYYGVLGDGVFGAHTITTPTQIINSYLDVIDIAMGYAHMLMLRSDGSVWGCGYNHQNQLGNPNSAQGGADSYCTPISVLGDHYFIGVAAFENWSAGLREDGLVLEWGAASGEMGGYSTPTVTSGTHSFTGLAGATGHRLYGHKVDRTVWAWGENSRGACGPHGSLPADASMPLLIHTSGIA